jgi:deoxyribonuclease-4
VPIRPVGARGVVVHTGSAVASDRDTALTRVRAGLLPLLDELGDDDPGLLLEPMAGQTLCAALPDLEPYLDRLDWHPRAGVCLDTCHAFAAGHDLATPDGTEQAMRALLDATRDQGGRLGLIHANDSRDDLGSGRDRHANIGAGQIGAAAFGRLLHHPVTNGVPFVVETPGDQAGHTTDIATLRSLRPENR